MVRHIPTDVFHVLIRHRGICGEKLLDADDTMAFTPEGPDLSFRMRPIPYWFVVPIREKTTPGVALLRQVLERDDPQPFLLPSPEERESIVDASMQNPIGWSDRVKP
jgi:hypothetical protein